MIKFYMSYFALLEKNCFS